MGGPRRFGELIEAVQGISPNILSQRLKHLEHVGLVRAERYSTRPPRYTYALTAAGQELGDVLRLLAAWGAAHGEDTEAVAHTLCGSPLQARWYCPTCDATVVDPEADPLRYA